MRLLQQSDLLGRGCVLVGNRLPTLRSTVKIKSPSYGLFNPLKWKRRDHWKRRGWLTRNTKSYSMVTDSYLCSLSILDSTINCYFKSTYLVSLQPDVCIFPHLQTFQGILTYTGSSLYHQFMNELRFETIFKWCNKLKSRLACITGVVFIFVILTCKLMMDFLKSIQQIKGKFSQKYTESSM